MYQDKDTNYILIEKVFSSQKEADEFINNKSFFNTPRFDYTTLKLEYYEPIAHQIKENKWVQVWHYKN